MNLIYAGLGRLIYMAALPVMRLFLRRSQRVYVLLQSENEVLVVKNWLSRQSWQLPGGGAHHGEAVESAARRELKEETGLKYSGSFKLVAQGIWQTDRLGQHYKILHGKSSRRRPIKPRRFEIIEANWRPFNSLNEHNSAPEIVAALKLAKLVGRR